jgi:hypothetical protein
MQWPQITIIVLWGIRLLVVANMHGKPKDGFYSLPENMVNVGVTFTLLWFGGFFG